jgi:hypothetical protein
LQRRQSCGRSIIGKSSRRARFSSGSTSSAFIVPALFRMKLRAFSMALRLTERRTVLGMTR